MATWIHPTLPLTPFQWVRELYGEEIFDSSPLFQLFQNNLVDNINSQMAFLFHLLGCHGDLHNCKKFPSILAFKKNSDNGLVIGMIAYTQLSVNSSLRSVDQTKASFPGMESYSQLLPPYRQTLTPEIIPNGTKVDRGHYYLLLPVVHQICIPIHLFKVL